MPRGNAIVQAYAERVRAEKDAQTVTTRCLWCPETVSSTLAEGRLWANAHLLEHHPDRVPTRRVAKRQSNYRTLGKRPLEDNIAKSRAEGGSVWVTDSDWVEA